MDFYNYTYLYANGYLKKFQAFFNNPGLTYQGLTAILKTFYKHKGWRMYKDDSGNHTVWYKGDLNMILNDPKHFLPQFQKICFSQWEKKRVENNWQNEPAINYSSDAENMEKVSQGLIDADNYGYGELYENSSKLASCASYIFCKDGNGKWNVLIGKRGATSPSQPNKYNVPVGMAEMGENAIDCACRECQEETGLNIPKNLFKIVGYETWAPGKIGGNALCVLDGNMNSHHIGIGDGENERFQWVPIEAIGQYPMAYNMGETINQIYTKYITNLRESKIRKKIFITEKQYNLIKESQTPEYGKIVNIYYKPIKGEDGDITYFVKQFYTLDDGYYTNFDTEYTADDLSYYFGEEVATDMINCNGTRNDSIMDGGIFINYDKEPEIDVTDVNAVNAYAKEQYGTTYNFKHAGYLLTTGELLDFAGGASPLDPRGIDRHNININGLDLYGFIALGNIRITPENPGFEFCKTPTKQQITVLQRFISQYGYKAGYFIVDKVDENGNNVWNKEYQKNELGNIISDITSSNNPTQKYRSQFADFLEEKKVKRIFVTEEQLKKINESYFVEPEKVKIVEKYLEDNFVRGGIPAIGEDGYPTTIAIVAMKGTDGQPAKNMDAKQLFYLLQDKFQHIYNNTKQRDNFLKQIIKDWYYKKIKNGLLSKNNYD